MKNMEADLDLDIYCDNCPYFEEETNTIKAKTINGDEIVNVYVTCENKKICKRLVDYLKTVQEPKVEQEPKTGHWITHIKSDRRDDYWPTNPKCSECGGEPYFSNTIYNYKFCPFCGAKMESE